MRGSIWSVLGAHARKDHDTTQTVQTLQLPVRRIPACALRILATHQSNPTRLHTPFCELNIAASSSPWFRTDGQDLCDCASQLQGLTGSRALRQVGHPCSTPFQRSTVVFAVLETNESCGSTCAQTDRGCGPCGACGCPVRRIPHTPRILATTSSDTARCTPPCYYDHSIGASCPPRVPY